MHPAPRKRDGICTLLTIMACIFRVSSTQAFTIKDDDYSNSNSLPNANNFNQIKSSRILQSAGQEENQNRILEFPGNLLISVSRGQPEVVTVKLNSTIGASDDMLNIQWVPINPTNAMDYTIAPDITIKLVALPSDINDTISALRILPESANLSRDIAANLDENFWPVRLSTGTYEITLPNGWTYNIAPSRSDPVRPPLDLPITVVLSKERRGLSAIMDIEELDLEVGEKLVLEVTHCNGLLGEYEVYQKTDRGNYDLIRKGEINNKTSDYKPYLIAFEVLNVTKEIKVEMFRPDNSPSNEMVFRLRLFKINKKAFVHTLSMHQVLDNVDFPAGFEVKSGWTENHEPIFELSLDEYLLNVSNSTANSSFAQILSAKSHKEDLRFRKQCGFDKSVLDGSRSTTSRVYLPVSKYHKEFVSPVKDLFQVGKRVMFKGQTVYRADSGVVEPHARSWADAFKSKNQKGDGSIFEKDWFFKLLVALLIVSVGSLIYLVYLECRDRIKYNRQQQLKREAANSATKRRQSADPEESMSFKRGDDESTELMTVRAKRNNSRDEVKAE